MEYRDFYIDLTEDYPPTWNKEEFEKINSFAGKLRYANTHLAKIATGSGRAVFKIDDQKVLKIAKNKKGLAQNSVEAERFIQQYDIVARTFDRGDEVQGIGPFWVEMELAKKVGKKRFAELTKITIDDLYWYLQERRQAQRKPNYISSIPAAKEAELDNNEFVMDLMSLVGDYDMGTGDLSRLSTYGEVLRDGQPKIVLVDFGLTNQVWDDYYKVKL